MGKDLQLEPDGVTFALEAEGERHDVRLAVPGRHNASNALAAIAAARALGVRLEDAVNALGPVRGAEAPAGDRRRSRRSDRDRRFRAQSRQDRRHLGDAARAAGAAADHVPAARLRTAREDGRGAGGKLRQRHGGRTTGCICPTRSIRAGRWSGPAGPTGSPQQVSERERHGRAYPRASEDRRACSPKPKPGDRIRHHGRARRHLDRIRAGPGRAARRRGT